MKNFTLADFENLVKDNPGTVQILNLDYIHDLKNEFSAEKLTVNIDFGLRDNYDAQPTPFIAFFHVNHLDRTEVDLGEISGSKNINAFLIRLLER